MFLRGQLCHLDKQERKRRIQSRQSWEDMKDTTYPGTSGSFCTSSFSRCLSIEKEASRSPFKSSQRTWDRKETDPRRNPVQAFRRQGSVHHNPRSWEVNVSELSVFCDDGVNLKSA